MVRFPSLTVDAVSVTFGTPPTTPEPYSYVPPEQLRLMGQPEPEPVRVTLHWDPGGIDLSKVSVLVSDWLTLTLPPDKVSDWLTLTLPYDTRPFRPWKKQQSPRFRQRRRRRHT